MQPYKMGQKRKKKKREKAKEAHRNSGVCVCVGGYSLFLRFICHASWSERSTLTYVLNQASENTLVFFIFGVFTLLWFLFLLSTLPALIFPTSAL